MRICVLEIRSPGRPVAARHAAAPPAVSGTGKDGRSRCGTGSGSYDMNVTKTLSRDIYVSGVARIYRMLLSCSNHLSYGVVLFIS